MRQEGEKLSVTEASPEPSPGSCVHCAAPAVALLIVDSQEAGEVETLWCEVHLAEAKHGLAVRIALGQVIDYEVERLSPLLPREKRK